MKPTNNLILLYFILCMTSTSGHAVDLRQAPGKQAEAQKSAGRICLRQAVAHCSPARPQGHRYAQPDLEAYDLSRQQGVVFNSAATPQSVRHSGRDPIRARGDAERQHALGHLSAAAIVAGVGGLAIVNQSWSGPRRLLPLRDPEASRLRSSMASLSRSGHCAALAEIPRKSVSLDNALAACRFKVLAELIG